MNRNILLNLLIIVCSFPAFGQKMNDSSDTYILKDKTSKYKKSVFGTTFSGNKIVLSSVNNKNKFTDLYYTDTSFHKLHPFASEIMCALDDGTPAFADNGKTMYYTSTDENSGKEGHIKKHQLKIAIAKFDGNHWVKGDSFPYNSKDYRTAHPSLSKDGNILVFSSDMPGGKGGMDLYYCIREGTIWSTPQNIYNINSALNELFPVIDNDGNLIFSSDGLPGNGGLDLFIARKNANGYDDPIHLNTPFNSAHDDFYLYSIDNYSTGYFSSNRYDDFQKDHVIYFERTTQTKSKTPKKGLVVRVFDKYTRTPLPYVTVTIKDKSGQLFHQGLTDLNGEVVLDELPKGEYVVQGMLNDISTTIAKIEKSDFKPNEAVVKEVFHNDPRFTLSGIVVNNLTNEPIAGVLIVCTNTTLGTSKQVTTGSDGVFFFQLEQKSDFQVQGQKKGWLSSEVADKTTKGLDRTQQLYVNLEMRIEKPVSKGTITLKKIHYDYDKSEIRADAKIELNRLVTLLQDYPDMTIELSSHTDSRGSDAYNLKLSQLRAEAAVNYLIQQGINKKRLIAKGYGESKLLNECVNGMPCTEAQHEVNRRTEFTILFCETCQM